MLVHVDDPYMLLQVKVKTYDNGEIRFIDHCFRSANHSTEMLRATRE